jgi:hypothetical protein
VHGAIAVKVAEEKKRPKPLILKKYFEEKKEKCMLKEEIQLSLD